MTYHNRLLSTPDYINRHQSPFWSYVASDTSLKCGEECKHSGNFRNMHIQVYKNQTHLRAFVCCQKCDHIFMKTASVIEDMIGYLGF